jgi:hypothetical protein
MVVPQNGSKWIVYNGKSLYKWMITGGTSILGNLHIPYAPCIEYLPTLALKITQFCGYI